VKKYPLLNHSYTICQILPFSFLLKFNYPNSVTYLSYLYSIPIIIHNTVIINFSQSPFLQKTILIFKESHQSQNPHRQNPFFFILSKPAL
jgi:hypothetical protein